MELCVCVNAAGVQAAMSEKPATEGLPESKPADIEAGPLEFDTSAAAPEPEGMQQGGSLAEPGAPGLVGIFNKVKENANHLLETKKPMSEFLDRSAMSKPATVSEGMTRLQKNLAYYRTNYFIFFLGTMVRKPPPWTMRCALFCAAVHATRILSHVQLHAG